MRGAINGNNTDNDVLRSPLAKRKRLVSERSASGLKQGFLAEDLVQSEADTSSNGSASASGTPAPVVRTLDIQDMEEDDEEKKDEDEDEDDDSTDSDDSSEEEDDDDDDFLARALGEDMG